MGFTVTLPTLSLASAALSLAASIPSPDTRDVFFQVGVPASPPDSASVNVDVDFAGLAFEQSSWVRYATDDNGGVNQFSRNLVDAIYSRTGGGPIIRLGGTSPDYGVYLPGQEEPALPVSEQDNYQCVGCTSIGPSYWPIAKLWPDARYMVQVPLATANESETVEWTRAAIQGIGLDQIHSIQIGNEPDLYRDDYTGEGGVPLQPPEFQGYLSNETYVGNYTARVDAIRDAVELPPAFFTAFDIGANVAQPHLRQWRLGVEACFNLGIDDGGDIKEVAHHYYQNQAGEAEDLEDGLMTLALTHRNLDYFRPHIDWLAENRPDLPFIINEIGNSLQPTNRYQYQARLGSALWAVDFYLYALSIGAHRFNYQQIMHSGFDLWLPHASGGYDAQVFSNYYSHPFLADAVGPSGETQIAKLDITGGAAAPNLAIYGAWDAGVASRVVVANLQYWNASSSGTERPSAFVDLDLGEDTAVTEVLIARLSSPDGAGAGAETITYGGSQWTFDSLGEEVTGVRNDSSTVAVENGIATVEVPDSEAVLVYLLQS